MFNDTLETDVATATTNVVITCDSGKTFNAGVIRAIVYYETMTAMANA